jgi:phage FluMu protein Com
MPIQFRCSGCDKTLRVPDNAAGLSVNCPECGASNHVPESRFQEEAASFPSPARGRDIESQPEGRGLEEEGRRPCPMCGEMIAASAIKCRYCGEVFDPTLRRAERKRTGADTDRYMTGVDILLAVLCFNIGCIVGIVYMCQGKPKGIKMIGLNLLVQFAVGAIYGLIMAAQK